MKYDWNTIGNGLFESGEVSDDGLECVVAKVATQLQQIILLILADRFETGRHVTEKLYLTVELPVHMLERLTDMLSSEGSPIRRFQWHN